MIGGQFLTCKISEHFEVEANANDSLHGGRHYQHVRDAFVEGVQHVLERVDINRIGQGCERASIEWHWCRLKFLLLRLQACV